jgi:O-antigen ligase
MSVKARLLQHGILLGTVIVTGLILPNSYDPVSAPKMFMLAVVVGFGLLFVKLSIFQFRKWDLQSYTALTFVILLVVNLLIHNDAFSERLFGVSGRSTGYFTLTAFLLLFFIARNCLDSIVIFLYYLALANIIVAGYFVSQFFGFDFAKYQDYYGAPSSTLGNPNFVSGFLGFSSIVFVELLRRNIRKVNFAIPLFLFFTLNIWVIGKTDSIQGFVALGIGTFVYCLYGVYVSISRLNFLRLSPVFILPLLLSFLGFFGIGPLSKYIASTTVFSRLDYWRASLSMLLDNPLTGVGLDAFGDNYRLYRDERAIARFGETQVTDSAHNVYLDIFSYGGLPLGLAYIALNLIPLLILVIRVRSLESQAEKREKVILLALWCGFQIQTLVSVNQIGVTIWIWIILGLMASNTTGKTDVKPPAESTVKSEQLLLRSVLFVFSTVLIFFCSLPLRANIEFLTAANKADGLAMKNIVERFPQDSKLIAMVASGFQNSNYSAIALNILNRGTRHNHDSFITWKLIYDNPKSSAELKTKALAELNRLDPRFPYSSP